MPKLEVGLEISLEVSSSTLWLEAMLIADQES